MGKKLYVGNLPFSTTEEELEQLFSQSGNVESVKLITDRATGRPKGFGFVEMANDDDAQNAIEKHNGQTLGGRPMTVSEARPMQPRSQSFGGGGQRSSRGGYSRHEGRELSY